MNEKEPGVSSGMEALRNRSDEIEGELDRIQNRIDRTIEALADHHRTRGNLRVELDGIRADIVLLRGTQAAREGMIPPTCDGPTR